MHCTLEVISRMQGSSSMSVKQQINKINVKIVNVSRSFYKIKVKKKQKQIFSERQLYSYFESN